MLLNISSPTFTGELAFVENPRGTTIAYRSDKALPNGFSIKVTGRTWKVSGTTVSKYVPGTLISRMEEVQ